MGHGEVQGTHFSYRADRLGNSFDGNIGWVAKPFVTVLRFQTQTIRTEFFV